MKNKTASSSLKSSRSVPRTRTHTHIYGKYSRRCSINGIIYRLRGKKQVCKSCSTTGSEATFCLLEQQTMSSIHFKKKHLTLLPYTHVLLINKTRSTYSLPLLIYSLLCHGRHQANEAIKTCRNGDDDDGLIMMKVRGWI